MMNKEIAGVKVFVSNEACDEYKGTLQEQINQLQTNWNSLREWLEEEKTRLARECSNIYEDSLGRTKLVNEVVFNELDNVLDKMNELEGVDNERSN